MKPGSLSAGILGLLALVLGCGGRSGSPLPGSSSSGGACSEIGCANGAQIDFSYRERGAYVVEVDVDGTRTTCKATLPLPRDFFTACDREGVLLMLVGSMLPPDQQSIGGLEVQSTTAKVIAVRVTRDGQELARATFDPVPWVTSPGPNGPSCEPKTCTEARLTLAR